MDNVFTVGDLSSSAILEECLMYIYPIFIIFEAR